MISVKIPVFGIDYLLAGYKLHYIESELIQTDRNISDIAARYGYTSIFAFSTLFKKIYHMSPLQYRKAHSH